MKPVILFKIIILGIALSLFGCNGDQAVVSTEKASEPLGLIQLNKISIVGLSEITNIDEAASSSRIKVYVDMLDNAGSKIKAKGVYRFELYDFVPRMADSKGKRIYKWSDLSVESDEDLERYWHGVFQTFEFDLELPESLSKQGRYVLLVTVVSGDGRRKTDEAVVKYSGD